MRFEFNSKHYSFKPRTFPLLAFICALSILISLSYWQFKRLAWKEKLISDRISSFELDPEELNDIKSPEKNEFRKITVQGKLLNNIEMYMPALSKRGNNGFHILVPLKMNNDKHIIFDTGWIPLKKKDKEKRLNNIIGETKMYEAVIRIPGRKGYFQPDNDINSNTWFFVETKLMSDYTGIDFEENFYLEATKNGPDGFPLGNQTRIYLRNNHLQYALTWMMIGMGLIGVFFFANLKRLK